MYLQKKMLQFLIQKKDMEIQKKILVQSKHTNMILH